MSENGRKRRLHTDRHRGTGRVEEEGRETGERKTEKERDREGVGSQKRTYDILHLFSYLPPFQAQ